MEMYDRSDADMVTMLAPLPGVNFTIINSRGVPLPSASVGKLFVRPSTGVQVQKFIKRRSFSSRKIPISDKNLWHFTQMVAFHQSERFIGLIDHYRNFVRINHEHLLSLGLIETILLTQNAVLQAKVLKVNTSTLRVFIFLNSEHPGVTSVFDARDCLNGKRNITSSLSVYSCLFNENFRFYSVFERF